MDRDEAASKPDSDRAALTQAGLGLLGVVVASVVVGYVGSHDEGFSWELASIFGTAVGTTGLAAATYWLASSTRSEVRATQQLAELTRRDQRERERPVVILRGEAVFNGSPRDGFIRVKLVNVGLGPALRVRVSGTYRGHVDWVPAIDTATLAALPPDGTETMDVVVRFPEPNRAGGVKGEGFQVTGTYLDRSRRNEYEIITSW